jgi:hypothetical protein
MFYDNFDDGDDFVVNLDQTSLNIFNDFTKYKFKEGFDMSKIPIRDMHLRRLYMVIDYEYYAQRMNRLKEELIQAYMHPKRVLKYLTKYQYDLGNDEYNYDF